METFKLVSSWVTSLFPVWTVVAAGLALKSPQLYLGMTTDRFTAGLALLMFSMGVTLTLDDFARVLRKPLPLVISFLLCFLAMPAVALGVGKLFQLPAGTAAGMVLVGSINGAQASNLCTYIAGGETALSVVMTTTTTLGCAVATPLLAKVLLGQIVPVDALGIAKSTAQVVFVPISLGIFLNRFFPRQCQAIKPFCPIVGVAATCVLVGASVAQVSKAIVAAGMKLQGACVLLHVVGGALGYSVGKQLLRVGESTSRTLAIEQAMKSSAFGFLLAKLHFSDPAVPVPSAVSVVWMAVIGASLAVFWRFQPPNEKA